MGKLSCLIVACLAIALTVSEIDAGCGGGSGAGLFGRGGGVFARIRARRQQSNAASYGVSYGSSAGWSSTSSFRSSSIYAPQPAVIMQAPAFLPMPRAVAPNGCNCPGNVPAPAPDAPMAKPPEKTSAAPFTSIYKTVMTTRPPIGHTHTCVNGHTWDHSMTSSHNCPFCGAFQNIQGSRPVTVAKTIRVDNPQVANAPPKTAPATPAARFTYQTSPVAFFSRASSSGCANGSCARY